MRPPDSVGQFCTTVYVLAKQFFCYFIIRLAGFLNFFISWFSYWQKRSYSLNFSSFFSGCGQVGQRHQNAEFCSFLRVNISFSGLYPNQSSCEMYTCISTSMNIFRKFNYSPFISLDKYTLKCCWFWECNCLVSWT